MRFLTLILSLLVLTATATGLMAQDKPAANPTKTAVFAGGCFWCMQAPFDRVIGVVETKAGFTGGRTQNPTYEEVSAGQTGHREAVEVTYDPTKVTYAQLLDVYWKQIDPTDGGGQFCDRGEQYTSAIFYNDDAEKKIAEESKMLLEADDERFEGKTVVTSIIKASTFYPAEDYHQSYYKKNPIRYKFYRGRCGRDDRLEKVWGIQAPTH